MIIILMNRNLMFSKETLDKVKLAKQFIQNRYQSIISQEHKNQQNWNKILTLLDPAMDNLEQIAKNIQAKQTINKRLQRQKDCLENYRLYNVIGRGAFGQVRLARNIVSNEVVAIKRLQKKYLVDKKQIYNTYLERDFMIKNTSSFIVQMKSTFQDEEYLYIVMEYVQGGDLLHLLIEKDILTEDQTRFYVAQLVSAIEEVHKLNYIHRDIKPDNILIDKHGHIKISDFGLSKYLEYDDKSNKQNAKLTKMEKIRKLTHIRSKQRNYSKVGTPDYISPQVLTEKTYNHSVDLWGIGVIMFQCLFGYPPFTDDSSKQVCHKVVHWVDYLEFPSDIKASTCAKMLILGLVNDCQKRLTIKQIKSHPFFEGVNWDNLRRMKPPFVPKVKDDIDSTNFDDFDLTNPWTSAEKQIIIRYLKPKARSQKHRKTQSQDQQSCSGDPMLNRPKNRYTVGPKFKFVGFDHRKLDNDPIQNFACDLLRQSHSQKSLKKSSSNNKIGSGKTIKFQQSQPTSIKNKLLKSKKTIKGRPSQFMNNTHNISFVLGRFSTSKEILKTAGIQQTNKQKQNMNTCFQTEASPRMKKKSLKTKVQRIKQIYSPDFVPKSKPKNFQYVQLNYKTRA